MHQYFTSRDQHDFCAFFYCSAFLQLKWYLKDRVGTSCLEVVECWAESSAQPYCFRSELSSSTSLLIFCLLPLLMLTYLKQRVCSGRFFSQFFLNLSYAPKTRTEIGSPIFCRSRKTRVALPIIIELRDFHRLSERISFHKEAVCLHELFFIRSRRPLPSHWYIQSARRKWVLFVKVVLTPHATLIALHTACLYGGFRAGARWKLNEAPLRYCLRVVQTDIMFVVVERKLSAMGLFSASETQSHQCFISSCILWSRLRSAR